MVLLKLLSHPCEACPQDDTHEVPAHERALYGASVISKLWTYRVTYGLRHEYWLMQACLVAATAIIFKVKDNSSLSKSMVIACQLLYSIGEFLPVANQYLLAIKDLACQQTIELPKACRVVFSGSTIRTKPITIKGPMLINIGIDYSGSSVALSSASVEVKFSGVIQGIHHRF